MLKLLFSILLLLSVLPTVSVAQSLQDEPPFALPPQDDINKLRRAILYTERGDVYLELFPEDAPWHVANFKYLADKGYYRGKIFHLHYPGLVIQGGLAPNASRKDPGYTLPAEFNRHKHTAGVLGMARIPDSLNTERRSSGRQFYISLSSAPKQDGTYTIFGRVIKGMEVVESLTKGDMIKDLKVFVRNTHKSGESR